MEGGGLHLEQLAHVREQRRLDRQKPVLALALMSHQAIRHFLLDQKTARAAGDRTALSRIGVAI